MSQSSTFFELRAKFQAGEIDKWQFTAEAGDYYYDLHTYAEAIAGTALESIEITADGVVFTFADEHIRLSAPPRDIGTMPVAALYLGDYEPHERAIFDALTDGARVIYDIGGNVGWYAVRWAKRNPDVRLHTFEPGEVNFSYLQRNVALNGLEDRVTVNNHGMSNESGTVEFFIPEGLAGNSSLLDVASRPGTRKVEARMRTVDEYVKETGDVPDFIKCDVEGAEYLVFKGAVNTITEARPIIHAELLRKWSKPFGYHPDEVVKFLDSLGYACFAINADGIVPCTEINEETVETNFVFFHREKHAKRVSEYSS